MLFKEEELGATLLIADLHIGYVYERHRRGIILPRSQRAENELLSLTKSLKPKNVIILGDFKDEIFGAAPALARRIWDFLEELLTITEVTIIKGNHDGKIDEIIPARVKVIPSTGLVLTAAHGGKSIGLWHGHATPRLEVFNAEITISGHAHPAYYFTEIFSRGMKEKVWIKAKWTTKKEKNDQEKELGKSQRTHIIMPAFNKYIKGLSVDSDSFLELIYFKEALDILNAEVFTLEGVLLGTIKELQELRRKEAQVKVEQMKEITALKKRRGKSTK
ncbi:MAG: hypothetical protein GF308_09955 [Candidatus Heimdallarchaeota archaeon]|nr:hypothetical protein [Candidatus Heimdallarchaeota archaeon]